MKSTELFFFFNFSAAGTFKRMNNVSPASWTIPITNKDVTLGSKIGTTFHKNVHQRIHTLSAQARYVFNSELRNILISVHECL